MEDTICLLVNTDIVIGNNATVIAQPSVDTLCYAGSNSGDTYLMMTEQVC